MVIVHSKHIMVQPYCVALGLSPISIKMSASCVWIKPLKFQEFRFPAVT